MGGKHSNFALVEVQDRLEENGNGLPEFDLGLVTAFLVKERISPRGMEAKQKAIEQGFLVRENEQKPSKMGEKDKEPPQKLPQMGENNQETLNSGGKPDFPSLLIKNVYDLMRLNPKVLTDGR